MAGVRKRQAADRVPAEQFEDMRLPAFTMFYSGIATSGLPALPWESGCNTGENEDSDAPKEFYLEHGDARSSFDEEPFRVLQWKASSQLRLLRASEGCEVIPSHAELLAAAEMRGMDGFLSPGGRVTLLRPADKVRLIDDDKRDGLQQELLTDMFTRMSLK
eukprot:TRINITY_DN38605_c0_g1_i1.p1 TRINITY_DN38605_c0_g1~~TRINITY_DN38605_c0_g1_i1.p1  ORF type:complete len:161 (+),score=33.65 TRINITY_DN38605_c0_g1_i1:143-625(+)